MEKISFYKAESELLERSACALAEKCYLNRLKTVILTSGPEAADSLNKKLWTYSQKKFIPHGSRLDPLPEMQPIYITDTLQNPNQAEVLMVVSRLFTADECTGFKRVIAIYDDTDPDLVAGIKQLHDSLKLKHPTEQYTQDPKGQWVLSKS